jgi:carbonic anhydrase
MNQKKKILGLLTLVGLLGIPAAHAANWQMVASQGNERIEIDLARIARAGSGRTIAWSRLLLGREIQDANKGTYTAVEAQNLYDCVAKRFTTIKRVYWLGDKATRSETLASPKPLAAVADSVDGHLLAEACKLRTVGEMQKLADEVGKLVAPKPVRENDRPALMHADVIGATAPIAGKAVTVADAHGSEKSDEKPAEAAAPKRFIELPKIDKSQVEHPRDAADAKPAETKAAEKSGTKPKATQPDRLALEKQYASSGPARQSKRKAAAQAEHVAEEVSLEQKHIHWSYEGEGGPTNWGKLRGDYASCASGKRQSPIDIHEGIRVDLEPITFDYRESRFRIVDNGHTVQVNVGEGSDIAIMGRVYHLIQFHFHRPSEERVNGKTYDMVAHLVHKDDEGHLAVVSVLIEKGSEHPLIQTLWNNLPLEVDQELTPAVAIDIKRLLPETRNYWTYMGSLTTPPCTEGVLWMVLKQPVQVSPEQIAIFSRLYRNNARPVQPANGRLIKETR